MTWDKNSAKLCIERSGGKVGDKQVTHPRPGLKILGAIDYLVNHLKYRWVRE